MQCLDCGRPLQPDDRVCPLCGRPVDDATEQQPTNEMAAVPRAGALQIGEPEDPFANTVFGGFAHPTPVARHTPPALVRPAPPASHPGLETPHALPPTPAPIWPATAEPRGRPARWLPLIAVACGLCVVAVLITGALASSGQWLSGIALRQGAGPAHPTAAVTARPAPSATAHGAGPCPLSPIDAHAAQALQQVQLATGIQSPQSDVPINHATAFRTGQTVYVTFELATNAGGSLTGSICTNGVLAAKTLAVPAGKAHVRGEFNLPSSLASTQVGPGSAILTWNGAVAAAIPFTVTT